MTHQRRSIIALLIALTLFFNIERLDFGQPNIIDIQTFVYVIGTLAVLSLIMLPVMWRASFAVSLALWIGIYLLCKVMYFNTRPLLGGIHTYLSITEVALLSLLIWLAHDLGRSLHDFEEAVKNITLSDVNRRVRKIDEAIEDIRMELVRSRRHQRPLTVIVIEAKPESIQAVLHRTVQDVQRAMMTRYVVTSLARVIGNQLRRTDMVLDQRDRGRFVILSPDTNVASSSVVVDRIQAAAAEQLGVSIACGIAAFPDDALTFEELVHRAEATLQPSRDMTELATYAPAETVHQ
jgi:GGDEF domain-containing protein